MQLSEAGTLAKHKILHIEAMFFRTGAELFLADVLALHKVCNGSLCADWIAVILMYVGKTAGNG